LSKFVLCVSNPHTSTAQDRSGRNDEEEAP
jgi:hypothetical protein